LLPSLIHNLKAPKESAHSKTQAPIARLILAPAFGVRRFLRRFEMVSGLAPRNQ